MLLYPAIDVLKTKVDSKYTLAILSARRARDLIDDKPRLIETDNNKPISIATAEIAEDLISYKHLEEPAAPVVTVSEPAAPVLEEALAEASERELGEEPETEQDEEAELEQGEDSEADAEEAAEEDA